MLRCWCHAAMAGWLGAFASDFATSSPSQVRRWQHECERAGGDCAARLEAIALRLPYTRAMRQGPALRIHTGAGPVEFVDGAAHHRYLGLLEPGPLHLVWRRGPEGVRFLAFGEQGDGPSVYESLEQLRAQQPDSVSAGLSPA